MRIAARSVCDSRMKSPALWASSDCVSRFCIASSSAGEGAWNCGGTATRAALAGSAAISMTATRCRTLAKRIMPPLPFSWSRKSRMDCGTMEVTSKREFGMKGICGWLLLSASFVGIQPAAALTRGGVDGCPAARDRTAIAQCTSVIESGRWSGKNIAWAWFNRGLVYESIGDHARAIDDFGHAIANDPGSWKAYSMRGLSRMRAGDNRSALADLSRALAMRPDDRVSLQDRADVYAQLGDTDRAITDLDAVLVADGNNALALNDRGYAWFLKGEYGKALADLDKSIALDPRNPIALFNRGKVKLKQGDVPGADADYAAARRLPQRTTRRSARPPANR